MREVTTIGLDIAKQIFHAHYEVGKSGSGDACAINLHSA